MNTIAPLPHINVDSLPPSELRGVGNNASIEASNSSFASESSGFRTFFQMLFRPLRKVPEPPLKLSTNEKGQFEVSTKDGFKVNFAGHSQQWTVDFPDGRSTKIWGDPHVDESDGTKWDFKDQSTFFFGKNKATVETTPYKGNKNATVSKTLSIYSGAHRVTISGIDTNNPQIETFVTKDGIEHDAELRDGDIYFLKDQGGEQFSWEKQ